MPIWTAATIIRFQEEGEKEIAKALNCITTRTSLDIVSGTATYSLPSDVISISRVTWKGKKKDPLPDFYRRKVDRTTTEGEPDYYYFSQQGRNTIRFYPIPNETIADSVTNLYGSEIDTTVIVEYYQLPDSDTVKIPTYIRRRLLKYYVLKSCFAMEGKGQKLKAAKKFGERFDYYMAIFKKIYAGHFISKIPVVGDSLNRSILATPRLPYTFGEPGEF